MLGRHSAKMISNNNDIREQKLVFRKKVTRTKSHSPTGVFYSFIIPFLFIFYSLSFLLYYVLSGV